ncbi:MAG TPA: ComEC/Rec2 family competence protein, partial [Chthoniobacterales bacterium]
MSPIRSWFQWLSEKIRRRRWPLAAPVLLFAAGIGAGDLNSWLPASGAAILAGLALAGALRWPVNAWLFPGIFLTGVALQSFRVQFPPPVPAEPAALIARGVVIGEPRPLGASGEKFRVVCRLRAAENWAGEPLGSFGVVLVIWKGLPPPAYGDEVSVRGMIRAVAPPRNPGEFDYAGWLKRRGIYAEIEPRSAADCRVESSGQGNPLIRFALDSRRWISRAITAGLDPADPAAALIRAMTLGDTEDVPASVREDFQLSGTLHVFSVSGLHIAMLAVIVWQMVRLLRLPRAAQGVIVIVLIFFYALVTGWSPPSVRAALMTACFILAAMIGRPPQPFNILAGAALVILLLNPPELFNAGFQLSFIVVAAILALARAWQLGLQGWLAPDPWLPRPLYSPLQEAQWLGAHHAGGLLSVSLAAWLGSAWLTGFHFHFVSFVAPLINLLVVPLSFLILSLATLSLLAYGLSAWLAGIFAQSNWLAAALTLFLVERSADLPGASAYVGLPLSPATRALVIVFDAGRGGAVVIQTARQTVLLDSGNDFFFQRAVLPYLHSRGIVRLRGLLLTHGDAAHAGGASRAVRELRPAWVGVAAVRSRSAALAAF